MRIGAAKPEAERLVRAASAEKRLEVLELRACRVARAAAGFELSRPPAFPRVPDVVARLFEQVPVYREPGGQEPVQHSTLLELMWIATSQKRSPRRRARRRGGERASEQRALARDAIERRRLHRRIAVSASVRPGPVVRDGEQDIWPPWRRLIVPRLRGRPPRLEAQRPNQRSCSDQARKSVPPR